jgi:small subunit ribosomal protein S4e
MAHIKKTMMPKTWPVPRKGKRKRFLAVPSHGTSKGISLLFLLRDVLKVARTRKEARYMTLNGMVKINNKVRDNENFPVNVLDVVCLTASEGSSRYYRLEIVKGKFSLIEVEEKDASSKIVKIVGKKILSGGVVQMNLRDGQNFISKDKFNVGDSVLLDTKEDKVKKVLGLKVGAKVEILSGKHAGEKGELIGFEDLVRGRNYEIKFEDGRVVKLPYKTILVVE